MTSDAEMNDFINQLFGHQAFQTHSESDIISMYIDGRITKEEYVRRMNESRGKKLYDGGYKSN